MPTPRASQLRTGFVRDQVANPLGEPFEGTHNTA
jgi:hypothetical protein